MKSHQNNTKTFKELSFSQQSKSISAQILSLEKAILAYGKRANAEKPTRASRLKNSSIARVERMLSRLKKQFSVS